MFILSWEEREPAWPKQLLPSAGSERDLLLRAFSNLAPIPQMSLLICRRWASQMRFICDR